MLYVYRKKCVECNGHGVVSSNNLKICDKCYNLNGKNCFICEKRGGVTKYHECDCCSGYGELFYDAATNKHVFLYAVPSYRFIN